MSSITKRYLTCWKDGPSTENLLENLKKSVNVKNFEVIMNDYGDYRYLVDIEMADGEQESVLETICKFDCFKEKTEKNDAQNKSKPNPLSN